MSEPVRDEMPEGLLKSSQFRRERSTKALYGLGAYTV